MGKGQGFPGSGPPPTSWPFMVSLGIVMAPVGVSFSMLMCYKERIMRLKVYAILGLVGFKQFLSYPQWLCHSFNGCALTPSLLSHFQAHLDCWQNSGPCGCRSEILVFLLAAGLVPLSAPRRHTHILASRFLPSQRWTTSLMSNPSPSSNLPYFLFCHQLEKTLCF